MEPNSSRWHEVTPSSFAHERAALDYVRELLPDRHPFQAWSNFTFVSDQGHVREVDLLVAAPTGFYLVEIKNYRGKLTNDGSTWTLTGERRRTFDNPLPLADQKAKELKGLLIRGGEGPYPARPVPAGMRVPRGAGHGLRAGPGAAPPSLRARTRAARPTSCRGSGPTCCSGRSPTRLPSRTSCVCCRDCSRRSASTGRAAASRWGRGRSTRAPTSRGPPGRTITPPVRTSRTPTGGSGSTSTSASRIRRSGSRSGTPPSGSSSRVRASTIPACWYPASCWSTTWVRRWSSTSAAMRCGSTTTSSSTAPSSTCRPASK